MKLSEHAKVRMAQRGIPLKLIETVRRFGRLDQDRIVLDKKEAKRALEELDAQRSALLKVLDKGGVVVVDSGDTVITTYNRES